MAKNKAGDRLQANKTSGGPTPPPLPANLKDSKVPVVLIAVIILFVILVLASITGLLYQQNQQLNQQILQLRQQLGGQTTPTPTP